MRKYILYAAAAVLGVTTVNCSSNSMKIKTMPYPQTAKEDVTDNYHGTVVADPYRWLEDDTSPETAAWVEAENEVTFDYLSQIPYRQKLRSRLTELSDYEKISSPRKVGERYFFLKNYGLQNQSVLYMSETPGGEATAFLDPNALSEDGTVALTALAFSEDGRYLAYSVSAAGSDWVEIFVKEIPSGRLLADNIRWVKFSGAHWAADSKGFYYSAYDTPAKGSELSGQNRHQKVYYHTLGTPQSEDRLIYADPLHPLRYLSGGEVGETGKWLFVDVSEGTHGTEVLFRETAGRGGFKTLFEGFEHDYIIEECIGDEAYVYTNEGAPNYRLAKIDLNNPKTGLTDVIPESGEHLLNGVSFVGGYIIATYFEDAMSAVYQYDTDGRLIRRVELPGIGTANGFGGKKEDKETFYTLSNFTAPPTVYRYDLATGASTLFAAPTLKYDPAQLVASQVFFTSKDGTRVPMFVIHRKDIKLDGNNPTYLYGYGGFNNGITPGFNPSIVAIAEQGGVYAVANLRGGNEYGEAWHRGGMLENKQNVFDDFIAAAEYLIDQGYTSSAKLAIAGASNGGLLVGACMTQRPDLFAVALPAVGVMDMLRYHLFTVGWGWAVEYGSSNVAGQFEYIYKYSPLHNIRPGVCYPATLITTADHDDRVVPAHSFKFAATLQAAQGCDRPTLIRIDTDAGHGAGKPTAKKIEETADVLSFFFWNTDSKYK